MKDNQSKLTCQEKIDFFFRIYQYQIEMSKFYDQKSIIVLSINTGILAASLWKLFQFSSNLNIFFFKLLFLFEVIIFIGALIFSFMILFPQSSRSELSKDSIVFFNSLSQIDTKERIRQLIFPKLNDCSNILQDIIFQSTEISKIVSKKDFYTKLLYKVTLINIIFVSFLFITFFIISWGGKA